MRSGHGFHQTYSTTERRKYTMKTPTGELQHLEHRCCRHRTGWAFAHNLPTLPCQSMHVISSHHYPNTSTCNHYTSASSPTGQQVGAQNSMHSASSVSLGWRRIRWDKRVDFLSPVTSHHHLTSKPPSTPHLKVIVPQLPSGCHSP